MKVDTASEEDVARFHEELCFKSTSNFKAISLTHDGSTLAIVGYDDWTHNAVTMHIVIWDKRASWSREFFKEAFRYPFEIAGRGLVIGTIPSYNSTALEFSRYLGFRELFRIKDGWALGTDLVIQEMRREECRFLEVKDGRKEHTGIA